MVKIWTALALLAAPALAAEAPPEVTTHVTDARLIGEARVGFFIWDAYDAQHWAPSAGAFSTGEPLAIALEYRTDFTAAEITDASIAEMARISGTSEASFAPVYDDLLSCFADVVEGDRITGISDGTDSAKFYVNGQQSCTFEYPGFRESFFGIWLGPNSRDEDVTEKLLGKNG